MPLMYVGSGSRAAQKRIHKEEALREAHVLCPGNQEWWFQKSMCVLKPTELHTPKINFTTCKLKITLKKEIISPGHSSSQTLGH